jgi:hypothetical protein
METFNPIFNQLPYLYEKEGIDLMCSYPNLNFEGELGRNTKQGGELKSKRRRPFCSLSEPRWREALDANNFTVTPSVTSLNDWLPASFPVIHKNYGNGENTGLLLYKNLWGGIDTLGVTKKIFYKATIHGINGFVTDKCNQYTEVNGNRPFVFAVRPIILDQERIHKILNILKDTCENPVIEVPFKQRNRTAYLSLLYKIPWNKN